MQTIRVGLKNDNKNDYFRVVKFENGGDRGLFEVAVIHDETIVYDTPVTKDTIGHLDFAGVAAILKDIEELPPRN